MAKVTLSDIAEKIGCSIATVSYALNRTRPISEEMERRILKTATELGYRPPCRRNRPSRKFIIILERRGNPVAEICQQFFQEAILRRGYLPLNCMSAIDVDEVQEVLSSLERAANIAGCISTVPCIGALDLLKYARKFPIEIYARKESMLCSVECNYIHRVRLAVAHLNELGHKKFGVLGDSGTKDFPHTHEWITLLQKYSSRLNMAFELIFHPEYRDDEVLFPLLDAMRKNGCTAIIAYSIFHASMIYQWAYQRCYRIPDELSVLAFGSDALACSFAPELTCVTIPEKELVELTVDSLIAKINKQPFEHQLLQPYLKAGGSTAGPCRLKIV